MPKSQVNNTQKNPTLAEIKLFLKIAFWNIYAITINIKYFILLGNEYTVKYLCMYILCMLNNSIAVVCKNDRCCALIFYLFYKAYLNVLFK